LLPMKKPFVSLSFTQKKLQILKLNSAKTQVQTFTTIDLPKGLISNYLIQDKKTLAEILKNAWGKLGFREKSVALTIPEFSTFTKSLTLPTLQEKELDEAVRWQLRDLLPGIEKDMVVDWKVINHEKKAKQILAVAVPKILLSNYVDAVGFAGLMPLAIETPSLSLVRISDHQPTTKLVVYANFGEVVLSLAQGEKILSSSVVSSADPNGVLWTAQNMVSHYQKTPVERIEVGGLELTQGLMSKLQQTIGKPAHQIDVKISGLSPSQIQEYLVPLSLQFKDPAEPRDETTVNLLPLSWAKHYEGKKLKRQVWTVAIIASLFTSTCFLASLATNLWLETQTKVFQKKIEQQTKLPADLDQQVAQANQITDKILKIEEKSQRPQDLLNKLSASQPPGIRLSDYKIDLDTGKVFLKGTASSRETLVSFKNNLQQDQAFSQVTIPISNFEAVSDFEFTMSLTYLSSNEQKPIKLKT